VDGSNGLRSAITALATTVEKIKDDFLFLKETAHNYRELKAMILRFLFTGSFAFIFQLGGVIWFFSSDHRSQEELTRQVVEIAKDIKELEKNQKNHSNE
jgi:sulfur transfer protein SufE